MMGILDAKCEGALAMTTEEKKGSRVTVEFGWHRTLAPGDDADGG